MEEDNPAVLHFGYTTADRCHWICESCFDDFKYRFQWQIEQPS
jgi:hypothetical protein